MLIDIVIVTYILRIDCVRRTPVFPSVKRSAPREMDWIKSGLSGTQILTPMNCLDRLPVVAPSPVKLNPGKHPVGFVGVVKNFIFIWRTAAASSGRNFLTKFLELLMFPTSAPLRWRIMT